MIVPLRGRSLLARESLESLSRAVASVDFAELVLVDNNPGTESEDAEIYRYKDQAKILKSAASRVGAVRNAGVGAANRDATILVFVDSDCVAKESFVKDVVAAFEHETNPTIVGAKVVAPHDGHWTELASDDLHRKSGDGPRAYLNSGCMAILRTAFDRVGGFSDVLPANEDYDLCARVRADGGTVRQFESLQVVHLGNPKSLRGVFKRLRWHGSGAVSEDGRVDWTPMAIATISNTTVLLTGLVTGIVCALSGAFAPSLIAVAIAVLFVPVVFWMLRMIQMRRWIRPLRAWVLMQVTFLARQIGMMDGLRSA